MELRGGRRKTTLFEMQPTHQTSHSREQRCLLSRKPVGVGISVPLKQLIPVASKEKFPQETGEMKIFIGKGEGIPQGDS